MGGPTIGPGAAGAVPPYAGSAEAPAGGSASPGARVSGHTPSQGGRSRSPASRARPLPCLPRSSGGHAEPHSSLGAQPDPPRLWRTQIPPSPAPAAFPKNPWLQTHQTPAGPPSASLWGVTVAVGDNILLVLQKLEGCSYPVLLPHTCPMQPPPCCLLGLPCSREKRALQLFQRHQQHTGDLAHQHDPRGTVVLAAVQGSLYPSP